MPGRNRGGGRDSEANNYIYVYTWGANIYENPLTCRLSWISCSHKPARQRACSWLCHLPPSVPPSTCCIGRHQWSAQSRPDWTLSAVAARACSASQSCINRHVHTCLVREQAHTVLGDEWLTPRTSESTSSRIALHSFSHSAIRFSCSLRWREFSMEASKSSFVFVGISSSLNACILCKRLFVSNSSTSLLCTNSLLGQRRNHTHRVTNPEVQKLS